VESELNNSDSNSNNVSIVDSESQKKIYLSIRKQRENMYSMRVTRSERERVRE
jgi:predicted RNA-binding protein with RPS1 domain